MGASRGEEEAGRVEGCQTWSSRSLLGPQYSPRLPDVQRTSAKASLGQAPSSSQRVHSPGKGRGWKSAPMIHLKMVGSLEGSPSPLPACPACPAHLRAGAGSVRPGL